MSLMIMVIILLPYLVITQRDINKIQMLEFVFVAIQSSVLLVRLIYLFVINV
jgi:hypothetical protein